jgi:3-methyladenine DNA glycosylase AlkD
MELKQIIDWLNSHANSTNVKGMAKFGINPKNTRGISLYDLRPLAKKIPRNHQLALDLWKTGIHEARILAPMIDIPHKVTEEQMEEWAKDFDSWDIVDQCCGNLFKDTKFAKKKILEWSERKEEFVKRTAFALICEFAYHDKTMKDADFETYFPIIKREATDERNFVKKAVNWALRNIGKRNLTLNKKAIKIAEEIKKIQNKTSRWIANYALRELKSEAVQRRLTRKNDRQ